jgi:uncharacterized protein
MFTQIVFAKLPILGQVKTRIAARSTNEFALNLYEHLLSACLLQAQRAAQEFSRITGVDSRVHWHYAGRLEQCVTARDSVIESFLMHSNAMFPQVESIDLGVRMKHALQAYDSPAILIGSDIPSLDADRLLQAMLAIRSEPEAIVFNPTQDGGYCLIGASEPRSMTGQLFTNISWSTPAVMQQTRLNLLALKMRWRELEPLSDIDDIEAAESYLTR